NWIDELIKQNSGFGKEEIREAVKWFIGDISGLAEKQNVEFTNLPVTQADLAYIVTALKDSKISGTIAKKVLEQIFAKGGRAEEIIKEQGLEQISDAGALAEIVNKVIAENQKLVDSLEKNPNAINALVGQVMKATRGQANPKMAEQSLREKLGI
ncbi:hypothetical protein KC640_01590, partial [Candidatus Dojkabacteria bacterium]|nr:hypothetical protein [Candidatus Dojkabacteria bacterium]